MRIGHNPGVTYAYLGVQQTADSLYKSMHRLSSGQRMNRPGDAPADYGIAQQMRYEIRGVGAAHRNLEEAQNLLRTSDAWLQAANDILGRMAELATAATDGSKSAQDQKAIQIEYRQMKEELRRIGGEATFNGIQVAGRDQILSYDQDNETFFFSQLDGTQRYNLDHKVLSGIESRNGLDFLFDPSKDFTKDSTGRYIFYVDADDHLTKYDIEAGTLVRSTLDSEDKSLDVDNQGRLWYASEDPPASGVYALRQMDIANWTQDTTTIANGDITDLGSKEFSVYEGRVTYLDSSNNIVSRSLVTPADVKVEIESSEHSFTTSLGQFAFSEDGQYIADVSAPGVIRVTNVKTQLSNTINVGAAVTVDNLTFSVDTGEVAFVDSAEGSIHRIRMELGDTPVFGVEQKLHAPRGTSGFTGLSLDGGSHRARFRVQHGDRAGQMTFIEAGDVRLHTLGLSHTDLGSSSLGKETLNAVQEAIHRISIQRSKLGAQESRINESYNALSHHVDNLTLTERGLTEADMAAESANMAQLQVQHQAAIAIMAQANSTASTALQLLSQ